MHKAIGGLMAGGLFVLPSLFILILLSYMYLRFENLAVVSGVLYGVKPAVLAIIIFATYRIGLHTLKNSALWIIAFASFIAIALFNTPFPIIILLGALVGFLAHRFYPASFNVVSVQHAGGKYYGKAVIDDVTPTPEHAIFSLKRLTSVLLVGLWLTAMITLLLAYGWQATLTQMAWFFTKAALLTFGGAYAVLPYVYQGAVEHYHWLTAVQMIDGLALGETTPGPLIMVVAFVGYVGGWSQQILGVENVFLSGVMAAIVVTFFTFLPSYMFIFIGAPFIESTQGDLNYSAPLTAITAAVVGVILSLAVFLPDTCFFHPNQSFLLIG